jgi:hypothetical protein
VNPLVIYNNGKLMTDSPIKVKWLENYIEFGKKCMKLESTDKLIDRVKSIGEIYTHRWTLK